MREFLYAFQNPVEYALVSKFSEIRKLKPVQGEALMEFMQRKMCLLSYRPVVVNFDTVFQLFLQSAQELADHGIAVCDFCKALFAIRLLGEPPWHLFFLVCTRKISLNIQRLLRVLSSCTTVKKNRLVYLQEIPKQPTISLQR